MVPLSIGFHWCAANYSIKMYGAAAAATQNGVGTHLLVSIWYSGIQLIAAPLPQLLPHRVNGPLNSAVKFLFTLFRNSLNFTVSLSRIACWFYRVLFLIHTSFSLKSVVKVDTGWLVTVKELVPTTETVRQESGREQHRLVHVSRASRGGSNSVHLDSVLNVKLRRLYCQQTDQNHICCLILCTILLGE